MNDVIQALGSMNPDGTFGVFSKAGKHYPATLSKDLTSDDLTDCDKVVVRWFMGTPYIIKGIHKKPVEKQEINLDQMQEEYDNLGGVY